MRTFFKTASALLVSVACSGGSLAMAHPGGFGFGGFSPPPAFRAQQPVFQPTFTPAQRTFPTAGSIFASSPSFTTKPKFVTPSNLIQTAQPLNLGSSTKLGQVGQQGIQTTPIHIPGGSNLGSSATSTAISASKVAHFPTGVGLGVTPVNPTSPTPSYIVKKGPVKFPGFPNGGSGSSGSSGSNGGSSSGSGGSNGSGSSGSGSNGGSSNSGGSNGGGSNGGGSNGSPSSGPAVFPVPFPTPLFGGGFGGGGYGGGGYASPAPTYTDPTPAVADQVMPVSAQAPLADLQVTNLEIVDQGNSLEQIGPRYRVTIANSSTVNVNQEFTVTLLAGNDPQPSTNLPTVTKRVNGLNAGQTTLVDLRLPTGIAANYLFAIVDRDHEISDANPDNNGAVVAASAISTIANPLATTTPALPVR